MTHNLKFLQKMLCIAHHDICFNTWVLVVAGLYDCMTQMAVIDTISKGKNSVITAAGIGGFVGRAPSCCLHVL
jgi:hypothetical protein